jgi:cytochrome c peroxidase
MRRDVSERDASPSRGDDTSRVDARTSAPGVGLRDPSGRFTREQLREIATLSPLGDPPPDPTNAIADDPKAAHFGRYLFFDERLSGSGEFSCATCHQPDHGFADPKRLSEAAGTTRRHAPSLLNVSFQTWYFWDGRADSTWAQVVEPFEAPNEQNIDRLALAHRLHDVPELKRAYESIFGSLPELSDETRFPEHARPIPSDEDAPEHRAWTSMTETDRRAINEVLANVGKAIAAYERRLVSGDSPFDRFVEGLKTGNPEKLDALSTSAKRGLGLFVGDANCTTCHFGPDFSDGSFHNLGLPRRRWLRPRDLGRYVGVTTLKDDPFNARGRYSDDRDSEAAREVKFLARRSENKGQFKTPTLRNVARTPPYMHGGHFETLEEVVRFYSELDARVRVGHREETLEPLGLTDREVSDLVAFLKSLSGEPLPERLKRKPEQPLPR